MPIVPVIATDNLTLCAFGEADIAALAAILAEPDVTKNITFPAQIDLDGNILKAKANFDIDRRQWNMNYGNDKTLGDKFISETVNIEMDLQAKAGSV